MAQLESKLDNLVSVLQSVTNSADSSTALRNLLDQQGVAAQGHLPQTGPAATPPSLSSSVAHSANGHIVSTPSISSPPLTSLPCSPAPTHAPRTDRAGAGASLYEPSLDETEKYLSHFRFHMLPYLPFIHLQPDLSAEQLRLEQPFLARAIIAVSSTSIQHKVERGRELKKALAQECLVENHSSLDLLLSLLTYVAWGSDQFLTKSETLSRLIMMAMSIVSDLGLNKPLPPDEHMIGPFVPEFQCPVRFTSFETGQPLLERQRAALACFLLSSMCVPRFIKIQPDELLADKIQNFILFFAD